MGDYKPVLQRRQFEECLILVARRACLLDVQTIDRRFPQPQPVDNVGIEILIRQEADSHERFEPVCRRAASIRAKSSGFTWLSGSAVRSSSRSPSVR
jgi:hypothetical protein